MTRQRSAWTHLRRRRSDRLDPSPRVGQEMVGPLPDFWPSTAAVWATTGTVKRVSDTDDDD